MVSGAALIHRCCWGVRGSHTEKAAVLARIQREVWKLIRKNVLRVKRANVCEKALYEYNVSMAQGCCSLYCDRAAALAVVPSWNKGGLGPGRWEGSRFTSVN